MSYYRQENDVPSADDIERGFLEALPPDDMRLEQIVLDEAHLAARWRMRPATAHTVAALLMRMWSGFITPERRLLLSAEDVLHAERECPELRNADEAHVLDTLTARLAAMHQAEAEYEEILAGRIRPCVM